MPIRDCPASTLPSFHHTRRLSALALRLAAVCLIFCAAAGARAAELKVLVIGSSQALSYNEAAFPPAAVASNLQDILSNDPALAGQTVTVTATDIYQSKGYSASGYSTTLYSRSLMSWFYWPPTRAATLALLDQGWDYVVLIDDPYVASQFPEYSFEGVRAIAGEVKKFNSTPLLVMTWPSKSTPVATFGEMAYRTGDAAGVQVVPAGYAWNSLPPALQGAGTRPNLQGAYVTAAAIYSRICNRSASASSYVPGGMVQTDRDSIADAALTSVQTEPSKTHYTGTRTGPTHFASPLRKGRSINYTDWNSSTEWGYRGGLSTVLGNMKTNWTQTYAAYQSFPASGFPYDFCQQRDFTNTDPSKWSVFGTFDYQDDNGAESMISGVDRVMYIDYLPEQETCAANVWSYYTNRGAFFVPVRVFWSRVATDHPEIAPQPDGHHLGGEYNQGVATMMFTLLTGRCAVGDEPADKASAAWKNWYCRKTGYEIAWQYATLSERVPGLEVLPASASSTSVAPGASTTLSVRFLYPPQSGVTVNVSVDAATAAVVSPASLTFTPQNYNVPQTVTVTGTDGATGSEAFNVLVSTASADAVFNGLGDQWGYVNIRPVNGTWSGDVSGAWSDPAAWSGGVLPGATGTADFASVDLTADRTVHLDSPLSVGRLIFGDAAPASAAGWTLDNNGTAANVLTLAGPLATVTVNALGADKTALISAVVTGNSGLTKDGPGTLVLTAANTYTGNTMVIGGTLKLQNTNGSPVPIGSGAIIDQANLTYALTGNSSAACSFGVPSAISGSGNLSMSIATVGTQQGYLQFPNGNVTLGGSLTFTQTGAKGYYNGFALVATANATSSLAGSSITLSGEIGIGGGASGKGYLSLDTSATNGPINLDVSIGRSGIWYLPQGLRANAGTGTITISGTSYGNTGWNTSSGTGNSLTGALQISASNFTTNDRLALHATAASFVTGNVTLAGTGNTITVDNGVTMLVSGKLRGTGAGFTKDGAGTLNLAGNNTFTGDATAAAGTVILAYPCLSSTSNVTIGTGAVLALNFNGTNAIRSLRINGAAQSPGTWGGVASAATYRTAAIAGTGVLNVTTGAADQSYTSWAAARNLDRVPGQSGFLDDPDGDGIPNGLEWVLGGDPLAGSPAPLPQITSDGSGCLMSFSRSAGSRSGATLNAQWSNDLVTWNPVLIGPNSSGPDSNGVTVSVVPAAGAPDLVVVAIPSRNAPAGRIFVRLLVAVP